MCGVGILRQQVEHLEGWGLMLSGVDEGLPAILRTAGLEYSSLLGAVDASVPGFLPHVIDDLHARGALLQGGTILVDEFRCAVLDGTTVAYAQGLLPDAFAPAVSERIAIDLFAASVALMSRLSAEEPAGCVAEEILAVALMGEAEAWLHMEVDEGNLSPVVARTAADELRGLFELFQDDDVLDLFEMREPADAAVAGRRRPTSSSEWSISGSKRGSSPSAGAARRDTSVDIPRRTRSSSHSITPARGFLGRTPIQSLASQPPRPALASRPAPASTSWLWSRRSRVRVPSLTLRRPC